MKNLSEKFGKVFTASFKKGNAEISFRFEIAYNDNLYEQKNQLIEDTKKCNEDVSESIIQEVFELDMFDMINHKYESFYSEESGSVYILNDEEKMLIVFNIADFIKTEKVSYSSL
jgi:hypothetical protein